MPLPDTSYLISSNQLQHRNPYSCLASATLNLDHRDAFHAMQGPHRHPVLAARPSRASGWQSRSFVIVFSFLPLSVSLFLFFSSTRSLPLCKSLLASGHFHDTLRLTRLWCP